MVPVLLVIGGLSLRSRAGPALWSHCTIFQVLPTAIKRSSLSEMNRQKCSIMLRTIAAACQAGMPDVHSNSKGAKAAEGKVSVLLEESGTSSKAICCYVSVRYTTYLPDAMLHVGQTVPVLQMLICGVLKMRALYGSCRVESMQCHGSVHSSSSQALPSHPSIPGTRQSLTTS